MALSSLRRPDLSGSSDFEPLFCTGFGFQFGHFASFLFANPFGLIGVWMHVKPTRHAPFHENCRQFYDFNLMVDLAGRLQTGN